MWSHPRKPRASKGMGREGRDWEREKRRGEGRIHFPSPPLSFFPAPSLSLPFPSPLKPWVSEDDVISAMFFFFFSLEAEAGSHYYMYIWHFCIDLVRVILFLSVKRRGILSLYMYMSKCGNHASILTSLSSLLLTDGIFRQGIPFYFTTRGSTWQVPSIPCSYGYNPCYNQ